MADGSKRPPDRIKAETDPDTVIRALDRAETVTVWDLPQDYNTLVSVASRVDIPLSWGDGRGDIETALAEHFTEDG